MLLAWQVLFVFYSGLLLNTASAQWLLYILRTSNNRSFICAPFIAWVAGAKIGKYKLQCMKHYSLFAASIPFIFLLINIVMQADNGSRRVIVIVDDCMLRKSAPARISVHGRMCAEKELKLFLFLLTSCEPHYLAQARPHAV